MTNTGTAALTIASAVASGDFAVASASNTCTAAAPGYYASFELHDRRDLYSDVTGASVGSLTLTDNAPNSPQVILLTGTGVSSPNVTVSPITLTFGSQSIGMASAAQTVTVSNSGTAALGITSIIISGDFSQTNNCGTSVPANNGTCSISVVFIPTASGTRMGSLTITDSAGTQVVSLTGGGADFSVSLNPTSATLVAGNTANVTITVNPAGGFNSAVAFTCTGLPAQASCSASPVTPSGGSSTATLSISTTQRTALPPGGISWPRGPGWTAHPWAWFLWTLLLLGLTGLAVRKNRLRWNWAVLALAMLWLASFAACGSGGTGYKDPTGTPAGNYTVTVTATSGGLSHSANVTLTVQ